MDVVRTTLNIISIYFIIYFNVIHIADCEFTFKFEPESIWHGRLRHVELKDDPILCADQNWGFESAKHVCRSLGFSDVMMYKSESNNLDPAGELAECTFENMMNIKCKKISSEDCDNVAYVACQLPGFEGCYAGQSQSGYTQLRLTGSLTIEKCFSGCRTNGNLYAALSNGINCYCSNQLPTSSKRTSSNCNKPCQGDSGQGCGGTAYSAVYNTLLGSCEGSFTSDVGFITSPGFPGTYPADANDCHWQFETSYFNRTLISMIGAAFEGGNQIGLNFDTIEINRRTYLEDDVTFDLESESAVSNGVWRTDTPITKEAQYNTVQKNMTVRYSRQRSNAKWFILKFEVEQVDFELMTSTAPPSTTSSKASSQFCLSYLSMLALFAVTSSFTYHMSS